MAAIEAPSRSSVGDTTHDLYRRYGRQIYAYCYHRLRSREEAEDAVQTTFMNAFRSLQRGATAEYEQAWLFKIAQNVCIARHASSSRRLRLETPNDFEVLQETVPAHAGEEPLELFGIEEALERMPENQRRAILLREWQGLSYREISQQLELSQAAVEMLIFRARRTLAGALEQPGEEKRRRVGRKAGSLGSIAAAAKTLLGSGAAIKAVAVAAAAVAVVGESASHTIVRHPAVHRSSARTTVARLDRAAAVATRPAPRLVASRHAAAVVRAVRRSADVRPPVVHPTAGPPQAAPADAPKPSNPVVTVDVPAAPAPAPQPEQEAPPTLEQPTPVAVETAPPATTTTTTTTVTATPAPPDPQPAHGNDGDHGHNGNGKPPTIDPGVATTASPAAPVADLPGEAKGLALGRDKQQP